MTKKLKFNISECEVKVKGYCSDATYGITLDEHSMRAECSTSDEKFVIFFKQLADIDDLSQVFETISNLETKYFLEDMYSDETVDGDLEEPE